MDTKRKIMSRPTGSKNKIPSKKDLVRESIQSINLIVGYINKHISFPTLTPQQQTELSIILEHSEKVLKSGRKHA